MNAPRFAYAQARIQSRYGQRPAPAAWEVLAAIVELPALLGQMRAGALRHWVVNIAPVTPPHEIERLLRARLCTLIGELERWVPDAWRAAVAWTAALVDLPALAHLLRGGVAHAWMQEEPGLRVLAAAEPAQRARLLAQGPLAALATGPGTTLGERWLAEWRRRWPPLARRERVALEALVSRVQAHARAFAAGPDGDGARRTLVAQLVPVFRAGFLTPVAAFAWLLFVALEGERVRAAVVTRAHFAPEAA